MTGSQNRFEAPMQKVTIRLDFVDRFSTRLPKVGV